MKKKHEHVENELTKLKTFDSSLLIGQSYFTQYFNQSTNNTSFSGLPKIISQRESKGLSNENFQPPYTANKHFSPKLV